MIPAILITTRLMSRTTSRDMASERSRRTPWWSDRMQVANSAVKQSSNTSMPIRSMPTGNNSFIERRVVEGNVGIVFDMRFGDGLRLVNGDQVPVIEHDSGSRTGGDGAASEGDSGERGGERGVG